MHQMLLKVNRNSEIDHIDGNGLNNQKANLRECSRSQNNMNQHKTSGTSKYKGVYYHKLRKKWSAFITLNRKAMYLGLFSSEIEAAEAYNTKAKELFGAFAYLNEI